MRPVVAGPPPSRAPGPGQGPGDVGAGAAHAPGGRTLLAFDYGRSKIGVAVGQELTGRAAALKTLMNARGRPDWNAIGALISEYRPDALLVGVPRHLDGSEHELSHTTRHFARQLHQRFSLPVYEIDERLTSEEARRLVAEQRASGLRRRPGRRGTLDMVAAQIMLQDWLDQHG